MMNEKSREMGKKARNGALIIVAAILGFFLIFGRKISFPQSSDSTSTENSQIVDQELHPSFHDNGSQLIIIDNDNFDYTNAVIKLNGDYSYKVGQDVKQGSTYTVGLMQFANSDGIRFNPFQMKIEKITLSCDEGFAYLESDH